MKRRRVLAVPVLFILLLITYLKNDIGSQLIISPDLIDVLNFTYTSIDWSQFAYIQYATNSIYLCNSIIMFQLLHRYDSKAERVLMYPSQYRVDKSTDSFESVLLKKARDEYNVKLKPIEVQRTDNHDRKQYYTLSKISAYINHSTATWIDSLTKLLVFNQTEYKRVIYLDSDAVMLQVRRISFPSHMCSNY